MAPWFGDHGSERNVQPVYKANKPAAAMLHQKPCGAERIGQQSYQHQCSQQKGDENPIAYEITSIYGVHARGKQGNGDH